MRTGRRQLAASPVLIGAVTLLVAIVAVFVSYNANQGLPFVPTYQLKAELPTGAKLVPGNEVRAGGFRVGLVKEITSVRKRVDGEVRSIAQLDLELDKQVEPLSVDSQIGVRPRSALGLKYVELVPGDSEETFADGDTVPLENAGEITPELEDVLATFPPQTRRDSQAALEGFGDAFAGRGEDLNIAIRELNPFLRHLLPVMENLSHPDTELRNFFAPRAAARERCPAGRSPRVPAHARPERRPRGAVRRARGPEREPEHADGAARPPQGGARHAARGRIHRPVPDGLQLLRLLLQPARHAPVVPGAGRHRRAHPGEAGGRDAAEQPRHDRVHAPGRRAGRPGPAGVHPAVAPHAVRRARNRPKRARGLPGRPDRPPPPAPHPPATFPRQTR